MSVRLGTMEELPRDYVEGLERKGTLPLWPILRKVLPLGAPERRTRPYCWRYNELRADVLRAGELTPIEKAERRVIVLANPSLGLDNLMATPTTLATAQANRRSENPAFWVSLEVQE